MVYHVVCNGQADNINMAGRFATNRFGTGVWKQMTQIRNRCIPGFSINNSAGGVFSGSQSFAVTTALYLTAGTLSANNSNILTLGNAASGQTLYIYIAANAVGGLSNGIGGVYRCRWPGISCRHDLILLRKQYHCFIQLPVNCLRYVNSGASLPQVICIWLRTVAELLLLSLLLGNRLHSSWRSSATVRSHIL